MNSKEYDVIMQKMVQANNDYPQESRRQGRKVPGAPKSKTFSPIMP
jgi:hypothetical protein